MFSIVTGLVTHTITMFQDKETKNTIRYSVPAEEQLANSAICEVVYLRKAHLPKQPPNKIKLTVEIEPDVKIELDKD